MADVTHEHVVHDGSGGNNAGLLIGIVLVVIVAIFLFYYGMPFLRGATTPQVNVPSQVDVNVKSE